MNIRKQPTNITITFSPKDYWIRKNNNNPDFLGDYCLTARIDMSYAGKVDQEGGVVMYLLHEREVKEFREAGFDEISGGVDPTLT